MNISLESDSRYAEAKLKLSDLQHQLKLLEDERDEHLQQLNGLANTRKPRKSRIDTMAENLLGWVSDEDAPSATELQQSYAQLTERIAVHQHAIALQRQRLGDLTSEISKTISLEVLPQHQTNVRAIVKALLGLERAFAAEAELRDKLDMDGVEYSSVIRPMPVRGIGQTSNHQSYISRYLLECLEYGFIGLEDLPDCLIQHIPSRGEQPVKKEVKASLKAGDWLSLN